MKQQKRANGTLFVRVEKFATQLYAYHGNLRNKFTTVSNVFKNRYPIFCFAAYNIYTKI